MASNEIIKKVMFGGFRREDVINYIEGLQQQLYQSQQRAEAAEKKAVSLQSVADDYAMLSAKFTEVQQKNAVLEKERNEAKAKAEDYLQKIAESDKKILSLQDKLAELEESCAGLSDSEQQINDLVMDAVNYSERIVGEARSAVRAASEDATRAFSATAQNIDGIGSEIGRISCDFSDVIKQLSVKLGKLSREMNRLNARFGQEKADADDGQYHLNADGLLLLDEMYMKKRQREFRENG